MTRAHSRTERRLIALAATALGLFDVFLTAFPAPFSGFGQIEDVVETGAINGSRFVLIIIGLLLLTAVPGLLHGKRLAWMIALACCAASAAAHPLKNVDLWGTLASVMLAGVLVGARTQFPARSDPPRFALGVGVLVVGLSAVFIYSVSGLWLLDREFSQRIHIGTAIADSARLLFIVPATDSQPKTPHGTWFVDSVRVAFLTVTVAGVSLLLQPIIHRVTAGRAERDRVRTLLQRYGRSAIAYFALLSDKAYFFSEPGHAVLAFKVVGNTAVVMGDPIGDESEFPPLLDAFHEHCELDGWAYAFHQVTPRYLDLYARHGLKALKIGEEAVVAAKEFTLSGTSAKHLRATMNRFAREGYRTEVVEPPHSEELLRRLRAVSDAWLAEGRRRERTFTLGQFDESMLQDCPIMLVRAPDETIVAFANIIPSYNLPDGNFDMLRYGSEPKAAADLLYVSLIQYFGERGFDGVDLGLAPFSGVAASAPRSPAERAMNLLYRRGSFLFRYAGLREFKEKFRPRWEPRYLIYGSDLQLPGIALAVARAGELRKLPRVRPPVRTPLRRSPLTRTARDHPAT